MLAIIITKLVDITGLRNLACGWELDNFGNKSK